MTEKLPCIFDYLEFSMFEHLLLLSVIVLLTGTSNGQDFAEICSENMNKTIDLDLIYRGFLTSYPSSSDITESVTCSWKLDLSDKSMQNSEYIELVFVEFDLSIEGVDDEEACSKNFLKILNNSGVLISGYCGKGTIEPFVGQAGKSYQIEARIETGTVKGFKLEFRKLAFFDRMESSVNTFDLCPNNSYSFTCPDPRTGMRCLPKEFKCDGIRDCAGNEDESVSCRNVTSDVNSGCGSPRRIRAKSGTIRSLGYPDSNYPSNSRCYWFISTPSETNIEVEFSSLFSIERQEGLNADDCLFDSLSIYYVDPTDSSLKLYAKLCGAYPPLKSLLPSNQMAISFVSDGGRNFEGFELSWSTISRNSSTIVSTNDCNKNDSLSGSLTGLSGRVEYKNIVDQSLKCRWTIEVPKNSHVLVEFENNFQIGSMVNGICPNDKLNFYKFEEKSDPVLFTKICGTELPTSFVIPSHKIGLKLVTYGEYVNFGFHFKYRAIQIENENIADRTSVPNPCHGFGVIVRSVGGMISTPKTLPSDPAQLCRWRFVPKLPKNSHQVRLELRFYDFTVDRSHDCSKPVLEIHFFSKTGKLLRGWYSCGRKMPPFEEEQTATTTGPVELVYHPSPNHHFDIGFVIVASRLPANRPVPARTPFSLEIKCGQSSASIPPLSFGSGMDGNRPVQKIVGGQIAKPGSWPWAVELLYNGQHLCAGTILGNYWILTAAHCFRQNRYLYGWQVVIGRHTTDSRYAWDRRSLPLRPRIKRIMLHKQYQKAQNIKAYDIALIQLTEEIRNPYSNPNLASPACLPTRDVRTSDRCIVVGWGQTHDANKQGYLQEALLPIFLNGDCKSMNWKYSLLVNDQMVCAGYKQGGIDSCQGDSGGPLACYVSGRWEVHGIVSFGNRCGAANSPGVYTRVFTYMAWIEKVITLSARLTDRSVLSNKDSYQEYVEFVE